SEQSEPSARGRPARGMVGLRRVSQSSDRDTLSGLSGRKTCLQDYGVKGLRVLSLPGSQKGTSPNEDRSPCLIQTVKGLSRCPIRDQQARTTWPRNALQTLE